MLETLVIEAEIEKTLKDIRDLKARDVYVFGTKLFKSIWSIVKTNVVEVIMEFFVYERMYEANNSTLTTLVPKDHAARTVKNYRSISYCTTIYKIISKILTRRIGCVMASIANQSQATFVSGQLIRGYSRKRDPPRCMLQLDIQKTYHIVY